MKKTITFEVVKDFYILEAGALVFVGSKGHSVSLCRVLNYILPKTPQGGVDYEVGVEDSTDKGLIGTTMIITKDEYTASVFQSCVGYNGWWDLWNERIRKTESKLMRPYTGPEAVYFEETEDLISLKGSQDVSGSLIAKTLSNNLYLEILRQNWQILESVWYGTLCLDSDGGKVKGWQIAFKDQSLNFEL